MRGPISQTAPARAWASPEDALAAGPRHTKTVALLVETSRAYGRGICQGIARYARSRPDWTILYQERNLKQSVPGFIRKRAVDGILMRVDDPRVARRIGELGIPTVDLLRPARDDGWPSYLCDDCAIAETAAEFFLNNGFVHFAFCGFDGIPFSDTRAVAFAAALEERGFSAARFSSGGRGAVRREVLRAEEHGFREGAALGRWLRRLPRPTALFACNDVRALQVLQACQRAGVVVPDDLAVLGVDNDEVISALSHPTLSSVQPDTVRTGHKACECLQRLMASPRRRESDDRTPPLGIVERGSTDVIAAGDRIVAAALARIRAEACAGLTVKSLVGGLGVSRSGLDAKFRAMVGRTVHDEITRVRVRRVGQLLQEGDGNLRQIAAQTGYLDVSHLSRVFKRHHGISPGEFRARGRR